MSNHNDYQKTNGATNSAKAVGGLAGRAAKKGVKKLGNKASSALKSVMKNLGKRSLQALGKIGAKSILKGILLKTAPIWGGLLVLTILILSVVSVFMPDVSASKASEYELNANELGIPAKYLLAFDTALYGNEDMEERNPNDSAYYFIRIIYEEFEPATVVCKKYDSKDKEKCIEEEHVPEEILIHSEIQGKEAIEKFLRKMNQSAKELPTALNNIRERKNTRLSTTTIPIEIAMEEANFTEEQKEYFYEILEAGFIDEEFPSLGFSLGFGAYCSPTKDVDTGRFNGAIGSAGVFAGHEEHFIRIAEKFSIDPVIMAAIALHETGYGTSNAVVNKNNPGGLMNPNGSGLFVYATLEDGLESLGKTLHNRIVKDGKNTIEKLGSVYAPVGAANDPTGLNNHWVPNITKIVQNLGGLTMNCEVGMAVGLEGATSESAEIAASSGFQWIGNSRYIFGGGRNQSDIGNGYFDCSSFVHWAYKMAGIDLGNLGSVSTETLNKMGQKVSPQEMQIGDLIFWDTYKRDGHVGIYVGNGKFIGAQSSTGVAIVDLNNNYWSSVFSGHVRRIIQ